MAGWQGGKQDVCVVAFNCLLVAGLKFALNYNFCNCCSSRDCY